MKKIMFNDRYGLTQAVLEGKKTMTRRIIPIDLYNQTDWKAFAEGDFEVVVDGDGYYHYIRNCGKYRVGEEVAIAQSYKELADVDDFYDCEQAKRQAGWGNKMFVKAELMPHRIRITGIKVERLQDITNEDAMREGVFRYDKPPFHHEDDMYAPWPPYIKPYVYDADNLKYFCEARYAFKYLINKVCGWDTWINNPFVFVYEFELIQ